MNEPSNKVTTSKTSSKDSTQAKTRFLNSVPMLFILCGTLFLVLGASLHELYGVVSPAFFVPATVLFVKTQKGKITRSTVYTIASVITGPVGAVFMILGLHVHPVFAYGALLLYFYAAFAIYCFVIIIASGEILKISGIVKVVLLFIIAILIGRIVVVTLEGFRHETKKAHMSQEQKEAFENLDLANRAGKSRRGTCPAQKTHWLNNQRKDLKTRKRQAAVENLVLRSNSSFVVLVLRSVLRRVVPTTEKELFRRVVSLI